LILRKITTIVATKCHILRLKYTKFEFDWSSAAKAAAGAYSAPPELLAAFKRPTCKEGQGRERERIGKARGKGGKGR